MNAVVCSASFRVPQSSNCVPCGVNLRPLSDHFLVALSVSSHHASQILCVVWSRISSSLLLWPRESQCFRLDHIVNIVCLSFWYTFSSSLVFFFSPEISSMKGVSAQDESKERNREKKVRREATHPSEHQHARQRRRATSMRWWER